MDKCIFNESNGLWYELVGDYYLPCLKLPEGEYRKPFYTALLLSGTLDSHLSEIDAQAEIMFSHLVRQLAKHESVTEKLKAENQMEWVGRMNNIRDRITEFVSTELIYT